MKFLSVALCALFWIVASTSFVSAEKLVWWYTPEGKAISLKQAVKLLKDYDVIMFGEYHDQTAVHQEQLAFLKEYYYKNNNIALSLEMIEKDNEETLKKYLKGEITEDEFLETTRPWPNYKEDYAPLVNFCKDKNLDVIASNIPRYLASQYAKEGTFDNIAADKKQYLPRVHITDKDRYFEEFSKVMINGGMQMPPEKIWNFYRSQCIKDDVMAQSIFDYLEQNKGTQVILK